MAGLDANGALDGHRAASASSCTSVCIGLRAGVTYLTFIVQRRWRAEQDCRATKNTVTATGGPAAVAPAAASDGEARSDR